MSSAVAAQPTATTAAAQEEKSIGSIIGVPNKSIAQVIAELEALESHRTDLEVPFSNIRLQPSPPNDLTLRVQGADLKIGPKAFGRLCSYLSVDNNFGGMTQLPVKYMLALSPEERADQVNRVLARKRSEALIRTDRDRVRGILTKNYAKIDNLPLVKEMARYVTIDMDVKYELNDRMFKIQAINKSTKPIGGVLAVDDLFSNGFGLSNSETGEGSVEFFSFLYRLVCTNGLTMPSKADNQRFIHSGKNDVAAFSVMADMLPMLDKGNGEMLRKIAALAEIPVRDPALAIEGVVNRYKLTNPMREGIENGFKEEPGHRVYDIVNAVTRAANNPAFDLPVRHELQVVGGRIANEKSYAWMNDN